MFKVLPPACSGIWSKMTRITPGGLQTRFYTQEWTQNVCFSRIRTAICPIRLPDDRERVSQNGHLH